ncbi:MAG: putative metal-dependent hydrolase of the TIM-barrel fold, partial [Ramlibacter sp.]|nr:putative metal-dependent hydrolase of the TIM-barrel fold [Ramlibacter sp.]
MGDSIPVCAAFDPAPRAPSFTVPPGACDCHAHVCGPAERYPYWPQRIYTPPDALLPAYRHMLDTLGIERAVLVQPSVYGTDNRAMLDTLAADRERLRGVAVVEFDVATSEIESLHAQGVRGVRCNIVDLKDGKGVLPMDALKSLASRIAAFGWHMEFLMHVDEFPDLHRQLAQ